MKILVVEDEPISALSVTWELEGAGHTVMGPVATMQDALRLVRRSAPELALVDIDLEMEGDGLWLARKLRDMDIATVFVSGKGGLASRYADLALGYIGKPYNPADIPPIVAALGAMLHGEEPAIAPPMSLRLFESVAN